MVVYQTKEKSGWYEFKPDDKLSHKDTKPEGPMMGGSNSVPIKKVVSVSASNEETHASLLIVDDEEVQLKLMKRLFSDVRFEIANSLSSALAAVELMKDCKVLLTDFNLSETETSIGLMKRVKERFPNAKVVVMSGNYGDAMSAADLAGITDTYFFPKPFDVMKLVSTVTVLLYDNPQ